MLDYYLFYDRVDTNLQPTQYSTSESYVKALRVQPEDVFSYMVDEVAYNSFFNEGQSFGFGWNITRESDNLVYFSLIDAGSPLDQQGVMRGDQLISINQWSIDDFIALDSEQQTAILGSSGEATTIELGIGKPLGTTEQVFVTSASYPLQTVLDRQVIEHTGLRIGYLSLYAFISTTSSELDSAFAWFASQNVDEMVLDLRFNGGGRVSVANELASYLIGDDHTDEVFTTFAYNDKYRNNNVSLNFQDLDNALGLNRVFVLQTEQTCSASELIVNSLRAFIPVITVGTSSCGKPYGTSPNSACQKVLNALQIELLNANNSGGYYNGIAADCPAVENVHYALGSVSEPLFSTALDYITNGSCVSLASRSSAPQNHEVLSLKKAWQGGNHF